MSFFAFLSSWLPVLAWAGLIFFLSHIPSLDTGWGVWDFVLRKIAHMTEYAVLTIFLMRAWRQTSPSTSLRKRMLLGSSVAVLYAISDEYHQTFVAGRSGAAADVVIDSCGIGLVHLVSQRLPRFLSRYWE